MPALNSSARGTESLELFEGKSCFVYLEWRLQLLPSSSYTALHTSMSISHPGDIG